MGLSSNSIVHFTSDKEALKGILSDNFKISYCKENIRTRNGDFVVNIPMVSFCDIPLSQVKNHIDKYGEYGIGMKREWAVQNKLNPVIYYEKNSNFTNSLLSAAEFFDRHDGGIDDEKYSKALAGVVDMLRYMKEYEADLCRKSGVLPSYRFSDEREWRYVPPIDSDCIAIYVDNSTNFSIDEKLASDSIASIRLRFHPNDIKYIIIKNENEIHEFIDHIDKCVGDRYSKRDFERLVTRILESVN